MHDGRQSASTGAGPPRAVAKLGLLNCYYWGQPIPAKLRICQHSQPCPRRSASPHWSRLLKDPPPKPERPHLLAVSTAPRLMCQFEGLGRRVAAQRWSPRVGLVCRQARGVRRAEPAGARRAAAAAVPCAGGRMELNSLLLLLEAAEYLERRDRGSQHPFVPGWAGGGWAQGAADRTVCPAEAEHGYASVLPFDGDFARKKTKTAGLVRKAPNNRYRPYPPPPTPARYAQLARAGPARVSPSSPRPQRSPAHTRAGGLEEVRAPPARRHLPAAAPPAAVNSATRTAPALAQSRSGLFQTGEELSVGAHRYFLAWAELGTPPFLALLGAGFTFRPSTLPPGAWTETPPWVPAGLAQPTDRETPTTSLGLALLQRAAGSYFYQESQGPTLCPGLIPGRSPEAGV